MKFIRADKIFQCLFLWSRLRLAPSFPYPIGQSLISNGKYPDPDKRPFLIPYSSLPWLLKIAFGIILRPRERERRHKDRDNHQSKNRVQSSERHPGENNREKQDQPSPYGRSQRIINRIKRERRNDHEEDRSQKRREIRKEGWQDLVGPHVHPVWNQVDQDTKQR